MHSFRIAVAGAVLALAAGGAALAQAPAYQASATLVTPASTPVSATVNGAAWSCAGADCTAMAARYSTLDSVMKECRKVSAAVGPLASYQARGRVLSAGNVSACNKGASVQTATR